MGLRAFGGIWCIFEGVLTHMSEAESRLSKRRGLLTPSLSELLALDRLRSTSVILEAARPKARQEIVVLSGS